MGVAFQASEENVFRKILGAVQAPETGKVGQAGAGAYRVKVLSKQQLTEYGLDLAKDGFIKKVWKTLLALPVLSGVAKWHLQGNTVSLLDKKNFLVAQEKFGITDRKEFKQLRKQGFVPKYGVLDERNSEVQRMLLRAHHAFSFVSACKQENHWIHEVMGSKAGEFASVDLGDIKSDFKQFQSVMVIVDNWDNLEKLYAAAGQGFPLLWKESLRADGNPDMAQLGRLAKIDSQISERSGRVRADLAIHLDQAFSRGQHYLPTKFCELGQPIKALEAADFCKELEATNKLMLQLEKQQGYQAGQSAAFEGFVKARVGDAANLEEVRNQLPALLKEFNQQCYSEFVAGLKHNYGDALVAPVQRVMEANEQVINGDLHFSHAPGFATISAPLEKLHAARETFVRCRLEDTFLRCVNQKINVAEQADLSKVATSLNALANEFGKLDAALSELSGLREQFERDGNADMFSNNLVAQVKALGDDITEHSINGLVVRLKAVRNQTLFDQLGLHLNAKYGDEIGRSVMSKLKEEKALEDGTVPYVDSKAYLEMKDRLSVLDGVMKSFGDEFSAEEFANGLNFMEKTRKAKSQPSLLSKEGFTENAEEITRTFSVALLDKRVQEYATQYGESVHPFIFDYLRDKEPEVFAGEKRYDECAFFQATTTNEQMALLEPYIAAKYPNISRGRLHNLLVSPDVGALSLDDRMKEIQTIHTWTGHLAPDTSQGAKRELAEQFAAAMGSRYLSDKPENLRTADDVAWVFRFAMDLNKKGVYSSEVVSTGIRSYLDNLSSKPEEALFAGGNLPERVTTGWLSWPGDSEKQVYSQCFKAHLEHSMRDYCAQRGQVYDQRQEALAKLFTLKFSHTDHLPTKTGFTLPYTTQLAQAAQDILSTTALTPGETAAYFYQAATKHPETVSFDFSRIDSQLSKTPQDVLTALPVALDSIESHAKEASTATYGSVLRSFRQDTGPAVAGFLRAMIEEQLPPGSKSDVKNLDRALEAISKGLQQSKYASIDMILDRLEPKETAETTRNILNIAQLGADRMPIDQTLEGTIRDQLLQVFKDDFASEMAKLEALPDNANISAILEVPNAPVVHWGIGELLKQIEVARGWRKAVDEGEVSLPLPEDAPAVTMFLLEILPDVRKWLGGETRLKVALKLATSKPGKFLLPYVTGPVLRLFGGKKMTPERRQVIVESLPAALRILDEMDLTNPKNQESIRKYVKLMDVILDAVNSPEEPKSKELSIDLMQCIIDLTDDLSNHSELIAGAVTRMAQTQ